MKNITFILFLLGSVCAAGQTVVINEVYGAGGNSGALFTHDYVELFNASPALVDLSGWSIQYASAAATGAWQVTPLSGIIEPGRHFLIQLGAGSGNGLPLPLPDVVGTTAMAASAGKVALTSSLVPLSGNCPTGPQIVDQMGYGSTATCFEGAGPTPSPSATLSVMRLSDGVDTNNNAADFRAAAPAPQHSLPRSQSISFASLVDRTYGDAPFSLTATASSGLPVTFETSDAALAEISGSTLTIRGAGIVTITARQAGSALFAPATTVQSLHIDKATLAVSVDPATRLQGDPNPPFTIRYSGFVGSDAATSLDMPPSASCTAVPETAPGEYEITLSGGSDNNYRFVLTPGLLTIVASQSSAPVQIISPADGAAEVVLDVRFKAAYVPRAKIYILQLSTDPAFVTFAERQGGRIQYFGDLEYATRYYLRVRTDLSPLFGRVTSFTTVSHDQAAVLVSPPANALHVGLSPHLRFDVVKGASRFFFEVSTMPDFSTVVIAQEGERSQVVHGLLPGTTYYVRAHTELSPVWGPVRSFRTAPLGELCFVKTPGTRSERVSWWPEFTLNDVGAQAYTVQLSEADDFAEVSEYAGVATQFLVTAPLKFRTTYFSRVRDVSVPDGWGPVRSFVTAHPADYAVLKYPEDGSLALTARVRLGAAPVPGATVYNIWLSQDPDFKRVDTVITTSTRSAQVSLAPETTWYARVSTDLSPVWGRMTSFSTSLSAATVAADQVSGDPATGRVLDEATPASPGSIASPNPFSDKLTIHVADDQTRIAVVTVAGEVIYESTHDRGTVEVGQAWLPGIYIVRLRGKETRTVRVLKRP